MSFKKFNLYSKFYKNKKIIITGHTGFKGRWLCLILELMGANVYGISKFDINNKLIDNYFKKTKTTYLDICSKKLKIKIENINPDYVFHLAAQPLVSKAKSHPYETTKINVLGTLNLLISCINVSKIKDIIIVTTDKCYDNPINAKKKKFNESDKLGGNEPYSASKASAEIITKSYAKNYLKNINVTTVRAGNVIGGGDFSKNRLIPDIFKYYEKNKVVKIRMPESIRPWIYVMDVLDGYISIPITNKNNKITNSFNSFNFGPNKKEIMNVQQIINLILDHIKNLKIRIDNNNLFHEDKYIFLDTKKAKKIKWNCKFNINKSVAETVKWYQENILSGNSRLKNINFIHNYYKD